MSHLPDIQNAQVRDRGDETKILGRADYETDEKHLSKFDKEEGKGVNTKMYFHLLEFNRN
jgi:hypothetical protein